MEFRRPSASLTKSVCWLMVAKTLAYVFTFALPLLLVRQLTMSEFGLYKQAFLIANTAVTALPLGFAMSAFYFLPRERSRGEVVFNILLFYVAVGCLSCLLLVLQPGLLAVVFNSAELVPYAPLVGVVILFWLISSFLEFVAIANGETKLAAIFIVGAHLTKTLLLLAAASAFRSLEALIYAGLVQAVMQTAVMLLYLSLKFPGFWRRFDGPLMRTQLAYALPLGGAGMLAVLQLDLHNYVVSNRFGAAAYAIYAIGCIEIPVLALLREAVGSVMIAHVNRLRHDDKPREILLLMARMIRTLAAVLLPTYFFLLITGRELLTVLFTAQYLASWPIFAINLALVPLSIIGLASDPVFRAYPEHRYFLVRTMSVAFLVLLLGLWLGTEYFGLVGAISAVVSVNCLQHLVLAFRTGRILDVSRQDLWLFKDVGKLAVAAGLAALSAAFARGLSLAAGPIVVLAVCAVVFGLVYLLSVHLFAVMTPDEYRALRQTMAGPRLQAVTAIIARR